MAGSCVRVDPPVVEFNGVKVGDVYTTAVTATNVGKSPKKILIEKPASKSFKFTSSRSAKLVAPGGSLSGLLEFIPEKEEEEVRDSLRIHIDDVESLQIPLLGFPRACSLLKDSVLDFGCVAACSQVISKHHHITNQESVPGVFQVQYNGDSSVRILPCRGLIAAGATQWLKVELCTDRPRQIYEKALLKLQNHSAVTLSIKAEVVDQHLEVFDLQGSPLSCLWFGPVYFGTSRVENVVLRNNSPRACDWVCLLQDTAAGNKEGADLQKSTGAALPEGMVKCIPATQDVSQGLVCVPNQGRLGPYDKTTVAVCFSPVFNSASTEKKRDFSASRQDYCFFLLFESVGSRYGFTHHDGNSSVELAVTGSGLPVSLVLRPSQTFDFPTCVMGQRVDLLCLLQNLCPQLPVKFRFHKLAHFTTKPSTGTIAPGQCQDVVLSFAARQQGSFQVCQKLDVLGHAVQTGGNPAEDVIGLELHCFHTITLHLSAVCRSETTHPVPKLNPGITPTVTNPTGSRPHVRSRELALCCGMVRAAVLRADKTRLHEHHRERRQDAEGEEFLAFPNDRAASIRPASAHRQYRTIFTGVKRYRYVDTSYAYTKEEEERRQADHRIYADFIEQLRQKRLQKINDRQQEKVEDDVDIGIVPRQGLVPPKLRISDLESSTISESKSNYSYASPAARHSCSQDMTSINPQVNSQVMSAVPSTSQEVADCNRTLTALELYQIVIGPLFVDFGEVCVQSVCVQKLELTNPLSVFVWVQLEVDCPELQGSSPLSHVLPPHSHNSLPLTFQSNKLGHFYRPVSFSVNQKHPGQILVQAQVVPLALELSTSLLVLRPPHTSLAQSGYRSSVTLRNQHNRAAEFTWRPVVTESGILFSIRPATGTVEPHRELDCEVVWHPSFSSPEEGEFDLCVHEGNTQRLHCVAKVGSTSIQLAEQRVIFGSVPLNMPSIRTAVLHNTGKKHAYYQVLDVCPLPGMVVSPSEGVVPTGGQAVLKIHFKPESVVKYDTRVEIALRNMKSIELRVGVSVEPPNVDISVSQFQFYGVHAGSQRVILFTLTNHSPAAARVTFDLSEYKDFSVHLPHPSAKKEPGVSEVEVQDHQIVDCSLVFSPTNADSYDFDLPLMVNGVRWPAASLSPPPTASSCPTSSSLSAGCRKHVVRPLPQSVTMAMQRSQRIQATVLCAPLEMSPSSLEFHLEGLCDAYNKTVELKAACAKSVFWRQGDRECINWWFDCREKEVPTKHRRKGGLCSVSPSSGSLRPGQSICLTVTVNPEAITTGSGRVTKLSLPLYLGDEEGQGTGGEEGHQPYRELSITINLQPPCITIHPPQILLTPVPLESTATATLTLLALGYLSGTVVSAEVDEVELEDGTKMQPFSIIFPEGNNIPAQNQDQRHSAGIQHQEANVTSLICSVTFCSAIPLSLCTTITFTDHLHNRFKVKLCAVADNCLLTVWPYMALHRSEQQIVLKTGGTAVEAVLQRYHTPSPASGPTSSSSSFDHNSGSESCDSVGSQASRSTDIAPNRDTPINLGAPEFPAAISEEGLYYQNVLLAVERWFTLFGWLSGPHHVSVPHTLRSVVSKTNHSSGRTYRVTQDKVSRSVVDMLHHLTGKQIPGIPRCQTFSADVDQRTKQMLQQHEAMLAFLRVQGARLCHIRPEYLLDIQEFKHWSSIRQSKEEEHTMDYSIVDYESLSKRSWTDVLLQIYKVLVLCRVSDSGSNNTTLNHDGVNGRVPVGSQPLASNIYSSCELRLLSWLNMHYQNMRTTVWGTGGIPSARWIVNFDLDFTDGLVLAALLAAYCPYLICSHFRRMYTTTSSLEQILHNNIIVAQALTALCLNLDVQPTDLSDPNPVQMLILCVHLYERLPQYRPLQTITLSGGLHSTFSKQVRLKSPSSKPIKYQVFLFGEDAHLFSLPGGSTLTIPPKASTELAVQFSCSSMPPMEAVLLLISSSPSGLCSTTLSFSLKTHVSHITPSDTVKCKSPCYQLKVIQVPITNPFNKEATFRVVLVESHFNPLEPETKEDSLVQASKDNIQKMTSDKSCGEEMEWKCSDVNSEGSEFHSAVTSICLKSGQADTLDVHFLPFCPGTKYCSVLLVCPQVGDMVYMIKATAGLPLPSPLSARPSSNLVSIQSSSDPAVCVSTLSIHCKVGQVCNELMCVPLVNAAWEQALAFWAPHSMTADEYRRRVLTHTLHSSTAIRKFFKQQAHLLGGIHHSEGIEYKVEASLPQYFALPSTVTIPRKEDTSTQWESPADPGCVDIPVQIQADSVGQFICQVVLRSWCDTRVYMLEALVTSQGGSVHLDFSSPAHRSVTQDIPLHNESHRVWKMQAELDGEGFSGPKVLEVPAETRVCYPLTFHPSARCIITGRLSLHNDCDGTEHVFTLRGVGEPPLPVDHVVIHCSVGRTAHTQIAVPNHSRNKLTLKVMTDLSVVSGPPCLEIKPGHSAPYTLAVSSWKRGKQTGCVSFLENDDLQEADKQKGNVFGSYKVHFSLEIICEAAAPIEVIDVQCVAQSSVAIEIPVKNPRGELLVLDVYVEGDGLSGDNRVSIPPRETLTYKATFSPGEVGKSTGSVVFQSELVGEFWFHLELYALPPPVTMLPQACCRLGKWTRQTIPLVNPMAEPLELMVTNSNPRNYTLDMDSGSTLIVQPHSSTQLGVRFRPSSVGEGNHAAKITFACPQLQEWCVLLSGRGLIPESEEPLSISSPIGSNASITIPITNPTELRATLDITLADEEPSGAPNCHQLTTDREVFSIPLSSTEGIQIHEGSSFDVPVVFAPKSMELQMTWLCITMKPCSSPNNSTDSLRSEQESSTICWIYPIRGIPMEEPAENSPLGVIRCEAGCQLERKVDVLLTGCEPRIQDQKGQEGSPLAVEDFLCGVHSDGETEVEDCLSVSTETARRDPETGIVALTLHLVYTPLRPCRWVWPLHSFITNSLHVLSLDVCSERLLCSLRGKEGGQFISMCSAVVAVQQRVSGGIWEFPITLVSTEHQVDDVICTQATELGRTSAVGFRLTSTTRRPEPFIAAFLPGSSNDFTVTPASGTLPPAGSTGALITVSFTPTAHSKHRAILTIQAADMQWTYEVKGKTPHTSTSSSVLRPANKQQQNFVARNLRLPLLANSSPLKVHK